MPFYSSILCRAVVVTTLVVAAPIGGVAAAESSSTQIDYGNHECLWSPYNQQERGGYSGPWQCNETVGVGGNTMTFNGLPWRARGVVVRGFVHVANAEEQQTLPQEYAAYNAYGPQELQAIRSFGADTIRFLVSQPSLDPQSSIYSQDYVNATVAALKQARQAGFVVMIAIQDETLSGSTYQDPLPTAETQRDLMFFNSIFSMDRGVLYELYNEPGLNASTHNWDLWKNGGSTGAGAEPSIGMQTLITQLRANGSQNVVVLDGLRVVINGVTEAAGTLEGVPSISDPLGRVVYAVHPYPHGMPADPHSWDVRFGNASRTIPVDADEWSAEGGTGPGGPTLGLDHLPTYNVAVDFLNYLRLHPTLSFGAGAFDIPDFMTQNVTTWPLTNYDNYSNSSPTRAANNAGLLVNALFTTDYGRPLTCADGVTPSSKGKCTVGR